ncbi:hypothetical protein PAN31117_03593 [Pandoraea anapnoica]|uniref:Uncharacterized protein n=1 Tax=Pandoraea anapnoica TaxID=2508301 RepID=A0A5E5ABK9_9BURK|nr:hypothetical protein [Pandoraea anapnoica]VVE70212.1 hypothetical protein PAN31117_03593 [Pandoraea anapnoica]
MNVRDASPASVSRKASPPQDAIGPAVLQLPRVPDAETWGGIGDRSLQNIDQPIVVLVPWSYLFVRNDILRLYWGDPDTPVAAIFITNPNDASYVLNVPVQHVLERPDGLVDVWFDHVSNISGDVGTSPVAKILVKRAKPGGNDPDQSTPSINENLELAQPPAGPIEPPISPEGVPVTIPAWLNMAEGDRLTLYWGSQTLPVYTVAPEEVGTDIVVRVDERTIIDAGDSEKLAITYSIYDVVKNYSLRAPPAFIAVEVGDSIYAAPTLMDAPGDVLDFDALKGEDATAIVYFNGDLTAGDIIDLTFDGLSYEGVPVSFTDNKPWVPALLAFALPNARLAPVVPGEGSIFYRVTDSGGASKGRSRRAYYTITGTALQLAAPVVREATGDGLDPSLVENGAHVDIAPWRNMAQGDIVMMYWRGTAVDGTPVNDQDFKIVEDADVGNPVSFNIMFSAIAPIAGGSVEVYYVITSGGGTRESAHLTLSVLDTLELPEPVVEGEVNGELDPALVPNGPKITIPQWPGMAVGDSVQWYWIGTSQNGQATGVIDITLPAHIGDVTDTVPRGVVEINAIGGDSVNVLYVVRRNGGETTSMVNVIRVLPLDDVLLPAPVVEEAVGDTLNPDDIDATATVTVAPYEGMAANDVVWVYFGEGTGGGEMIDNFLVSDNNVGDPIQMFVPKAKVEFFDTATVTIYYKVLRNGTERSSYQLILNVASSARWPAPTVPESTGGNLPEDAYAKGVRTVVPQHPEMRAGDEIHIYWEGNGKEYWDRVEVSIPMDFPFRVDAATVDRWAGETVQIRYTVTRPAGVIHSEVLTLNVAYEPTQLALPEMDQVIGDKLNLADLTYGADVRVLPYEGMRVGDTVHIDWAGGKQNGGLTIDVPITQNAVGQPIEEFFELDEIEPYEGQTIEVAYRIVGVLGPRQSDPIEFTIVSEAATMEPPQIPDVVNGELDPRQVMDGAKVIVPRAGMQQGDMIFLTWDCTNDEGDHTDSTPVGGGAIEFTVPYEAIEKGINGTVTVSYEVRRGGATIGTGSATPFVIVMTELPAVVIVEANGSNLDPDQVPGAGATAEIAATAVFALDDVVTLYWEGVTDYQTSHRIGAADVGKSLRMMIPKVEIERSDGTVASVYYKIVRKVGGATETSPRATYSVGRELAKGDLLVLGARNGSAAYRASSSPRYLRAVDAVSRLDIVVAWRYEGDLTAFTGASFLDTDPWRLLHVRTEDASTSILPVHFAGTGTESASTTGAAAFGALLKDSNPYAWGHKSWGANIENNYIGMNGFVEISTTPSSMAARQSGGTVFVWGQAGTGGEVTPLPTNVRRVIGNAGAFAGILNTGSLTAWGSANHGGTLSNAARLVRDAHTLSSTGNAFCVRRVGGELVTWGPSSHGGELPPGLENEKFKSVMGNFMAFCALRENGRLAAWHNKDYGGELSEEAAAANNVASLASATARAFAVLTTDRKVIAWGPQSHGGVVTDAVRLTTDFVEIVATWGAFCGRRANGRLLHWGDPLRGNDFPPAYANLDFIQVVGTARAFAGLLRDGSVLSWGDANFGGNSSVVAPRLVNVRAVYANSEAFAAIRDDGEVVTWGIPNGGGTPTNEQQILLNQYMSYEAQGSAVSEGSAQGKALAIYRRNHETLIVS